MAESSAESSADHTVGTAFFIGQLGNHHWVTGIAGQLDDSQPISNKFGIPSPIPVGRRFQWTVGRF